MTARAWNTLRLEPTVDRAEIRRAYARRLKLTNPEDDPAGFQALREAYDWALAHADHVARAGDPSLLHQTEDREVGVSSPSDAETVDPGPDAQDRECGQSDEKEEGPAGRIAWSRTVDADLTTASDWEVDEHRRHAERLSALASGLAATPPASSADLRVAFEAVLRSPAMEQIQVQANTEAWIAGLLAHHVPRSDPLIPRAVEAFRWEARKGRWDLSPEMSFLLERAYDLRALAKFADRNHPLYQGYKVLTRPPGRTIVARWLQGRQRHQVAELLERFRKQRPSLIGHLNREAVTHWTTEARSRSWRFLFAVAALLFGGLILAGVLDRNPEQEAADKVRAVARRQPDSPAAWADYCNVIARNNVNASDGRLACDSAVELNHGSPPVLRDRAFLHMRQGEFKDAAVDYSVVLEGEPDDAEARYGRGLALYQLGQSTDAVPDLRRALQLNPGIASLFLELHLPMALDLYDRGLPNFPPPTASGPPPLNDAPPPPLPSTSSRR